MAIRFPIPARVNSIHHMSEPVSPAARQTFIRERDLARQDMVGLLETRGVVRAERKLSSVQQQWARKLAMSHGSDADLVSIRFDHIAQPGPFDVLADKTNRTKTNIQQYVLSHFLRNMQLVAGIFCPGDEYEMMDLTQSEYDEDDMTVSWLPALLELGLYQYIMGEQSVGLYFNRHATDKRVTALRMAHFDERPVILAKERMASWHDISTHGSLATDHDFLYHSPMASLVDSTDRRALGAMAYVLSVVGGRGVFAPELMDSLVECILDGPNFLMLARTENPFERVLFTWYSNLLNDYKKRTKKFGDDVDPFNLGQKDELYRLAYVTAENVDRFIPNQNLGVRIYQAWEQTVLGQSELNAA